MNLDALLDNGLFSKEELLQLARENIVAKIEHEERVLANQQDVVNQLEKKRRKIDELIALEAENATLRLTPTGRVKRGASKEIVAKFIKDANGTGVTINDIVTATGTKYGTVRRAVMELESEGKAESAPESKWRWKTEIITIDDL